MKLKKKLCFAAIIMFAVGSVIAEITLPKIFSDGMVLQRDMPLKIWGKATPNARIGIEFAGKKKMTKSDKDGKWEFVLDSLPSSKEPLEMTLLENGKADKNIKDILVGEVWITAGQSNMEWARKNTTEAKDAKERAKSYNLMRVFRQPHQISLEKEWDSPSGSKWHDVESQDAMNAIGFYFGEILLKDLDVPIGLVETPLGGSAMRAWIPQESFAGVKFLEDRQAEFKKQLENYNYEVEFKNWNERKKAYDAEVAKLKKEGKEVPQAPFNVRTVPNKTSPQRYQETPSGLFNAKIAPIAGYAARGVIWYQGESDAGGASLESFVEQFEKLVDAWRKAWGNEDLYFFWAQLTSYSTKADWGLTRWKQLQCADVVKKSGIINIIDLGEENDIHPKDKTTVGKRFAMLVLKDVYGKKGIHAYAPVLKNAKYGPRGVEVFFETYGRKLVGKGDPRGFEVLVGDKWEPAKVEMLGRRVLVKPVSGNVADVQGVRYLWKSWAQPDVWLFNGDGLPVFSFTHLKEK